MIVFCFSLKKKANVELVDGIVPRMHARLSVPIGVNRITKRSTAARSNFTARAITCLPNLFRMKLTKNSKLQFRY